MRTATARNRLAAYLSVTSLTLASARDIPSAAKEFYDSITGDNSQCSDPLADGFTSIYDEDDSFVYCGRNLNTTSSVLFLQGTRGALSNMDVCCDGIQGGPADDGRCESDPSMLSITAFQWIVEAYEAGNQTDLDANVHPYIVFGNTAADDNEGWPTFDPQQYGIEPLSVMAVLCGGKLFYGIWGDMNGDDGDAAMVGEASISLATACFGQDMNGNSGYDGDDVLYLAFPGEDAVPGKDGAKWDARDFDEFEESISELGDRLMKRLESSPGDSEDSDDSDSEDSENTESENSDDNSDADSENNDSEVDDNDDEPSSASRAGSPVLGMIQMVLRITRAFV